MNTKILDNRAQCSKKKRSKKFQSIAYSPAVLLPLPFPPPQQLLHHTKRLNPYRQNKLATHLERLDKFCLQYDLLIMSAEDESVQTAGSSREQMDG